MSLRQRIKYMLGAAVIAITMLFSASAPTFAEVKCPDGSLRKTAERISDCNVQEVDKNKQLPAVAVVLIDVVLGVLGIVAVAVVILGGIQYTTSAGDPGKAKKAKDTILYGLIGLIIAFLAFAIVNFILDVF